MITYVQYVCLILINSLVIFLCVLNSQGEETCSSTDTSEKPDSTGPGEKHCTIITVLISRIPQHICIRPWGHVLHKLPWKEGAEQEQ